MGDESLRQVNAIAGRLSLRPPQRDSLLLLDRVCEIIQPRKGQDVAAALEVIRSEFPQVTDFERDFPSLCFALATGVGKTRLMGAFAAWLHRARGIRHFFVLAPNLTIYNKLISDFTPGHAKYVFQGIAEFAQNPPEIITGDNYESGRGVREETRRQGSLYADDGSVHINIFNISKINTEVRGGKAPRIKRLSEYIGQSYFEYLSELDDLVLMMDESHRYRASAGVAAINELKPILGLELTATPRIETGGGSEFKNVIYSYPLSAALNDGFVKEPAVATRENFDADNYDATQLERLKLEDGVRVHENVKVELEVFARQTGKPFVKPFMLVVAQDTAHADDLVRVISDDSFFEGQYRDKVIQVHSNQTGQEKDATIERLLQVEDPAEPTEIVVHVNKLKEGWDVTNLYTIVPLRAAKSQILTEQTIGRGLRLPFGQRTGVAAVDRLTIIAHDQFQAIIDEANNPDSIIRTGVVIGRDIGDRGKKVVKIAPTFEQILTGTGATTGNNEALDSESPSQQREAVFTDPGEKRVAGITLEVIKKGGYEKAATCKTLLGTEAQMKIAEAVREALLPLSGEQAELLADTGSVDIEAVVATTTRAVVDHTIDIPRITIQPKGEVNYRFADFDVDVSGIHLQPVSEDILIQHLATHARYTLKEGSGIATESRPEDYLVWGLVDFDDISYDHHSELLYKLAAQVVAHLRSYLDDEDAVSNVLQYHQRKLSDLLHSQMQKHYEEAVTEYEVKVSHGFTTLRETSCAIPADGKARNFRQPPDDPSKIRRQVYGGFTRCLYPAQRFHSDSERQFAVLLENEQQELKWFKPGEGQFRIHFSHDAPPYEPDFVVETDAMKYLCEPKRADQVNADEVQAKARAAVEWCKHASAHEAEHDGKPWQYLLIPHDAITASATLSGLAAKYWVK